MTGDGTGVLVRSTHTVTLLSHHVADLVLKFDWDVVVSRDLVTRSTDLSHQWVQDFVVRPSGSKGFRRAVKNDFTRKMSNQGGLEALLRPPTPRDSL